jgi:hypothetical protein
VQLLRQTDGWYKGVKAVWVPNYDGTLHDILWASFDQDEPIPDWIRRVPWFTMATQVLTTASSSPWTVDGTWNASSNSVELVGKGQDGGAGTTGANSSSGSGGGGAAYTKLTNGALGSTVDFAFSNTVSGVGGSLHTTWESSSAFATNCYYATGGDTASNLGSQGTPGVTFTIAVHQNKVSGSSGGTNHGGGGGGGAAGPAAIGGTGGSTATGNGGAGGGGANNGASGNGGASSSTSTFGSGGQGSSGSPGATTGASGTGNSGGAGTNGTASGTTSGAGGKGGSGTNFDATHGLGGGGGGSGQETNNTGSETSTGGDGGLYGGGGGGCGGLRGTTSPTFVTGKGGDGVIFITWTPAVTWLPFVRRKSFIEISRSVYRG